MPKDNKHALADSHAIALQFYDESYRKGDKRLLLFNNGDFYWWHNPHWEQQEVLAVRTNLWADLAGRSPEKKHIDGALDALKSIAFQTANTRAPCWLVDFPDQPDPRAVLACNNGLLDIEARLLMPLTPDFFNLNYLPIDYAPEANEPTQWLGFLASLWPDDQDSIDCLQEIFGYLLTQDTSQHKIFLLIGPKRSGKSTIARLLTAIIGHQNVASPTLSGLVSTAYSCECLINTQLAVIGDARISPKVDQMAISEILLGVSGEDSLTIQRKYRPAWTGRLNTRFLILTNEVPALSDASGALASRLIALETQQSFYGREDLGLEHRLLGELQEILHWSLAGLDRLRARGYFTQPDSGLDLKDELQRSSSPISQFIEDKCDLAPGYQIECGVLFGIYSEWCQSQGRKPGTVQSFGRVLKAAAPTVKTSRPRSGEVNRDRFYEGIRRQS